MDSMVRSETPEPDGAEPSLGDLVALAAKDVSQLIRYEIGLAAFGGCLVLVMLCFAYAYGLITLGIWPWAAFLIVAGTLVLLAGLAVLIAYLMMQRLSGLSQTRKTVTEGIEMLRSEVQHPDGQRPEITAPKTR